MPFGAPSEGDQHLFCRRGYAVSFNLATNVANWVSYVIDPSIASGPRGERPRSFFLDPHLPAGRGPDNRIYAGNNYDRGHLVFSLVLAGAPDLRRETFIYSAVAPQIDKMNRDAWLAVELLGFYLLTRFSCCGSGGWVDPDGFGKRGGFRGAVDEAFGVKGPGGLQGTSALSQHIRYSVMMDIIGGEHRDPGMAVLGVVPGEERPAEGDGGGNVFEAPREAGVILQGLELRFGERVVIADLGAAQRAGDPEVGEELGGALAGHRRAAVRMQGEHLGLDALLETGFLDQRRGERGVLPIGNHPAHDAAAEDVEQDIEVEGRPAFGPPEPGDIPGPGLVGARGHQLGLGVAGMTALIAPLSHRLVRGQDPVHRALGAQILAFIEQRRDDLGR